MICRIETDCKHESKVKVTKINISGGVSNEEAANIMITAKKHMQWLHVIHIISISIWLGSAACIFALALICFFQLNGAEFLTVAPLIPELYRRLVFPVAVFTLVEGVIYGAFTKWGFFRHRWITWKWGLVVLTALATGVGGIGQMFAVLQKVRMAGFAGGWDDGGRVLFFISLQIIFMITMVILSVFKVRKQPRRS